MFIFQEEEKVPTVPLSKIMKMNATEWPYILSGAVGSAIQGCIMPLYAVMFGEVLGVMSWAWPFYYMCTMEHFIPLYSRLRSEVLCPALFCWRCFSTHLIFCHFYNNMENCDWTFQALLTSHFHCLHHKLLTFVPCPTLTHTSRHSNYNAFLKVILPSPFDVLSS